MEKRQPSSNLPTGRPSPVLLTPGSIHFGLWSLASGSWPLQACFFRRNMFTEHGASQAQRLRIELLIEILTDKLNGWQTFFDMKLRFKRLQLSFARHVPCSPTTSKLRRVERQTSQLVCGGVRGARHGEEIPAICHG